MTKVLPALFPGGISLVCLPFRVAAYGVPVEGSLSAFIGKPRVEMQQVFRNELSVTVRSWHCLAVC